VTSFHKVAPQRKSLRRNALKLSHLFRWHITRYFCFPLLGKQKYFFTGEDGSERRLLAVRRGRAATAVAFAAAKANPPGPPTTAAPLGARL